MRLTRDDSGTRRTVSVGEPIEIALPEVATTGYRWRLDAAGNFEQIDDQQTATALPMGASGLRVLTLRPRCTGQAQLRLVKRRSWEQNAVDEFVVDLDVQPVDEHSAPECTAPRHPAD
jgi:predicted secreted protein